MATVVESGGDSGAGILAIVVIIAAIVVALFAFGAFNNEPINVPAPGGNSTTIHVSPPSTPSTPSPTTPSTPPNR
jgi:hypothetical protein